MQNKHFLWSYILNNKSLLRYWMWVLWNKILILHSFVFHGVMSKGQDCCCMSVPLGSGFHGTKPWYMIWMGEHGCRLENWEDERGSYRDSVRNNIGECSTTFIHMHTHPKPHTCTNGFPVFYHGHCLCPSHCGLVTLYGDIDMSQHWLR